jgi:hypothetical protein
MTSSAPSSLHDLRKYGSTVYGHGIIYHPASTHDLPLCSVYAATSDGRICIATRTSRRAAWYLCDQLRQAYRRALLHHGYTAPWPGEPTPTTSGTDGR